MDETNVVVSLSFRRECQIVKHMLNVGVSLITNAVTWSFFTPVAVVGTFTVRIIVEL